MKVKSSLAALLAFALALGLCACAPEEQKAQTARTPFAAVRADPLAYLNAVVPLLRGAESFVAETSYAMDDIEIGNDTLKAAKNLLKSSITAYIGRSFTKEGSEFFVTEKENVFQQRGERVPADMDAQCPALSYTLLESDLLAPTALEELIEGKIAGKLKELNEEIAKGLVEVLRDENGVSLKDENGKPVAAARATDAQKRAHVVAHLNEALIPGGMLTPLKANEVLELQVADRLRKLEEDIEAGRNSSMKNTSGAEKRQYALEQLGETAVNDATGLYQLDGKLAFEAAEKLFAPADKADILAQLALAKDYLVVEDYELEYTEFTLYAQVNKRLIDRDGPEKPVDDLTLTEDMLKELKFTLRAKLTATATGAGAFQGAGEFPITLTLTKTVQYKNIKWKAVDENA